MTHLMFKDELLDLQLLRVVGAAAYGGSDIGECLQTAKRISGSDLDSWYAEWLATADAVAELGEREAAAGHREAAQRAYLRASSYYRTAGVMLMGVPLDPRLVESNARETETFRLAGALMARPPEILEIPFEGATLAAKK
jgi:hypothetical protein